MTRVEELTAVLADETATPEERAELDRLVAADPAALRIHLLMLDLEGLLRAEGPSPDLRAVVSLDAIEKAREARMLGTVMPRLGTLRPGWPSPPRRRTRAFVPAGLFALGLAAAILIGVGGRWNRRAAEPPGVTSIAAAPFVAAGVRGSVSLIRRGGVAPLPAGAEIEPGDQVHTGAGAQAHLARGGGADLALGADTRLVVEDPSDANGLLTDVVMVARGRLEATVAAGGGRALSARTPHAWATAAGTRFSLVVDGRQTRLEVKEGRMSFRPLADRRALEVTAGQHALAVAQAGPRGDAGAEVPARGAGEPVVVVAYDFEADALDAALDEGQLVRGSPCPGKGLCVVGTLSPPSARRADWRVLLSRRDSGGFLFSYNERQVLTFDYWVGAESEWINVKLWNRDRRDYHSIYLYEVLHERWGRATVRLSDLRPSLDNGDAVSSLFVLAGVPGGGPLYIDNIRVAEWPAGPLPESAGGRPPDPVLPCARIPLSLAKAVSDRGFSWMVVGHFGGPADSAKNWRGSRLRLFENDHELGPPHTGHPDIRNLGRGRFMHWISSTGGESLCFSASDNSDPRTNGRSYAYCAGLKAKGGVGR